jgi:hypothetical protein
MQIHCQNDEENPGKLFMSQNCRNCNCKKSAEVVSRFKIDLDPISPNLKTQPKRFYKHFYINNLGRPASPSANDYKILHNFIHGWAMNQGKNSQNHFTQNKYNRKTMLQLPKSNEMISNQLSCDE